MYWHFFFKNPSRRKQDIEEAHTTAPHTMLATHYLQFFRPIIDHDDHPDSIFQRLYLGPQPRYEPSAASVLSPTPVAIDGCPPIICTHCGSLVRNPNPTTTRGNQLFCVSLSLFKAFCSMNSHPSSWPCFRIIFGAWNVSICHRPLYLFRYLGYKYLPDKGSIHFQIDSNIQL
jgi:hypothetical protein